jgi:hypothetical protein
MAELARSAEMVEFAQHAFADAERRRQIAVERVGELTRLHHRSQALWLASHMAIADARDLLKTISGMRNIRH